MCPQKTSDFLCREINWTSNVLRLHALAPNVRGLLLCRKRISSAASLPFRFQRLQMYQIYFKTGIGKARCYRLLHRPSGCTSVSNAQNCPQRWENKNKYLAHKIVRSALKYILVNGQREKMCRPKMLEVLIICQPEKRRKTICSLCESYDFNNLNFLSHEKLKEKILIFFVKRWIDCWTFLSRVSSCL